jgi:hypothetical protein
MDALTSLTTREQLARSAAFRSRRWEVRPWLRQLEIRRSRADRRAARSARHAQALGLKHQRSVSRRTTRDPRNDFQGSAPRRGDRSWKGRNKWTVFTISRGPRGRTGTGSVSAAARAPATGKTAGKGTRAPRRARATTARAAASRTSRAARCRLQRRLPKRGFTNLNRVEYQVVNLFQLEQARGDGDHARGAERARPDRPPAPPGQGARAPASSRGRSPSPRTSSASRPREDRGSGRQRPGARLTMAIR